MKATVRLSSIKIPASYAATIPSEEKMEKQRKKYEAGKLDKRIVVNTDGFLIDGYIKYLILKENNIKETKVKIVKVRKGDNSNTPESYRNTKTTYIYGKHPNDKSEKIYTW